MAHTHVTSKVHATALRHILCMTLVHRNLIMMHIYQMCCYKYARHLALKGLKIDDQCSHVLLRILCYSYDNSEISFSTELR